ncbi:MAG: DNA polymerase [Candidatus Parcubacteria bacterium]|nr:DNA polymerase [Candidatus Parcubacteria bacterium]
MKKREKLVLLDMHAILHRGYHALPDFVSTKGEPTGALYGLMALLFKMAKDLHPDYIVAAYDLPEETFRHKEYKEYKAGRAKTDDSLIAQIIRSRDVLDAFGIPRFELPGFEADDMIGTISEEVKKMGGVDVIIASGDMDTLQLVDDKAVQVYTLRKGINDTVLYDEKAVFERYGFKPEFLTDYKGLAGDKSDNIPGIVGIGEKSATMLIQAFGSIENIYKKLKKDEGAFEKEGIKPRVINLLKEGEEEALFSKALATIRRDAKINFELPKKKWGDMIDHEAAEKILYDLEFRTLRARLPEIFGEGSEVAEEKEEEEDVPAKELKEAGIALWLLNSELTNPNLEDMLEFSHKNSFREAKKFIFEELSARGLKKVYEEIELPLVPIIDEMEKNGIRVDVEYLKNLSVEYHKRAEIHEKKIYEMAGEAFNINSPKQLGEILFDKLNLTAKGLKKTAGGARSTRESELEKLADSHPIIAEILEYRELQKLLSTYIDNIPDMVGEDGRLHTTFIQTGTTTGRMSSNNPNLQNIPTHAGYGIAVRNAFVAEDGYTFASLDYSQIEMRVLAALSDDEIMIETFREGKDIHSAVAMHVFGVSESDVTKDMRRRAKVINFGIIYGMGITTLQKNLGGTRAEAEEFHKNYFEKFPKIASYFEKVKKDAVKLGYTETLFGRRRYFPGLESHIPYVKAMAERMAMNAPLQGTAADIMKLAMIQAHNEVLKNNTGEKARMLLQVHDELIFEIKKEDIDTVIPVVKKAMENACELSVPLIVSVATGKNWGSMDKET